MSNGTGGSQHYFRNTIRRVLQTSDPASIRDTTIDLGGERVAATEISFRPFANDPNRARLREFADKSYHARSEEHTSELQSLLRISYAAFCLKKKTPDTNT